MNTPPKPHRLARKTIIESPWVNHHIDKVEFPGGRIADQHHILEHDTEAVAALITNAHNEILMIQAYRYVTNSIEWEIPAGLIDPGETTMAAGKREVFEETGYETTDLQMLYTYHPMNGISNQTFNIITGRALDRTGNFDINEVKSITWHCPEKVRQMIADNTIKDGYTLTALLLHLLQIQT